MTESTTVALFTDGACQGNPGPGGWGVVLQYQGHEKTLSGYAPETTNNRMELMAVIEGLKALKRHSTVHITTDSKYVLDGIQTWIISWKKNGWKNSHKKPVKNADLWQTLDVLVAQHEITWHWVKGHSGHPENEQADALAVEAIEQAKYTGAL